MADDTRKKLRRVTTVYWVLLLYIIAALVWWFLSLMHQNTSMYQLQRQELGIIYQDTASVNYRQDLHNIEDQHRRNVTKYVGEGITFLLLTLVGALFVYRAVRRQFRLQRQQQNFIMAITHELKTPIAVSRLNLETLQKYQLDEPRRSKLLQMTLQETLRLDTLINNILIASQLDGRSYQLSNDELDFSHLTSDLVQQFSSRYPDRVIETGIEEDVDIRGDQMLLKLLISNLLENANKYSPRDQPIHLQLRSDGSRAALEVADHGPGIPPEEREHVFEKFYRLGNEQTRKAQGTGLGLYLCKKIAEDHNGTIAIEDNQPEGTKFIVHLPVNSNT
ncbi:MAG TPA: ATP-binding protein [Flavisolibacter sp.]